jgi:hypothetical protein
MTSAHKNPRPRGEWVAEGRVRTGDRACRVTRAIANRFFEISSATRDTIETGATVSRVALRSMTQGARGYGDAGITVVGPPGRLAF